MTDPREAKNPEVVNDEQQRAAEFAERAEKAAEKATECAELTKRLEQKADHSSKEAEESAKNAALALEQAAETARLSIASAQEDAESSRDEASRSAELASKSADRAEQAVETARQSIVEAQRVADSSRDDAKKAAQEAESWAGQTAGAMQAAEEIRQGASSAQQAAEQSRNEAMGAADRARASADAAAHAAVEVPPEDVDERADQKSHLTNEDQQLEVRLAWSPVIVFALMMVFCLMLCAIYLIQRAERYGESQRMIRYSVPAWVGCFILPLLAAYGCFWFIRSAHDRFKAVRDLHASKYRPTIVLLFNATACFLFVVLFLYGYALPLYHRTKYEDEVDFVEKLPWPSILPVLLSSATVVSTRNLAATLRRANGSDYDLGFAMQDSNATYVPIFNASSLGEEYRQAVLNDRLILVYDVTFNSSGEIAAGRWFVTFADPRLTLDEILNCNLFVTSQVVAVISDTVANLDVQRVFRKSSSIPPQCIPGYSTLLADREEPLSVYAASITGSPLVTTGNCEAINQSQQRCTVSIIIQFGSRIRRTTNQVPGISKTEIWLNVGAIVGGVQFLAWMLNGG